MKMKLNEILEVNTAFNLLKGLPVKLTTALQLARIQNPIKQIVMDFEEIQKSAVKKYELQDRIGPEGLVVYKPEDEDETKETLHSKWKGLMEELKEVQQSEHEIPDVEKIPPSDLQKADGTEIDVPYDVLSPLLWIFEE